MMSNPRQNWWFIGATVMGLLGAACGAGSGALGSEAKSALERASSSDQPAVLLPVNQAADAGMVQLAQVSCEAATEQLRAELIRKMEATLNAELERYLASGPDCAEQFVDRDTRKSAMMMRGRSHPGAITRSTKQNSTTNLLVERVDEADVVKHDGSHLYLLSDGRLRVFSVDPEGKIDPRLSRMPGYRTDDYLKILSSTEVGPDASEFFLHGERIVLLGSVGSAGTDGDGKCRNSHGCVHLGDASQTRLTVLDISNKQSPKVVRQATLSGSLLASRRLKDVVHLVLTSDFRPALNFHPEGLPQCFVPDNEEYARAKFERLKEENARLIASTIVAPSWTEAGQTKSLCGESFMPPERELDAFLTVASFDLSAAAGAEPQGVSMVSQPGAVHASEDRIFIAVPHRNTRSDLHSFHLGARPDQTEYEGSGAFDGVVESDFSMSESGGVLRVVTARGPATALSTLARNKSGDWVEVGVVDGIAPGEELRAVRFDKDRAYLVTFLETDPLFVIDLANPQKPVLLGELKIPGFSTYLQPLDADHLLSIGFRASAGRTLGLQLQVIAIGDGAKPTVIHREALGGAGSTSDAAVDHHAVTYLSEDELLLLPVSLCFSKSSGFQGLEVFRVSPQTGFLRLGRLTHRAESAHPSRECRAGFGRGPSYLSRSVVIDGLIASILPHSIKAQHLQRLKFDPVSIERGPDFDFAPPPRWPDDE